MEKRNLPKTFLINHDDYHAEFIGRLNDGRQFFLTTPFVPKSKDNPGCEFVALFYFDKDGALLEAKIDNLGPRATMDHELSDNLFRTRLDEVVGGEFTDIEIAPFTVERFGIEFGFIPEQLEDGDWTITLQPGDFMAFFAPWDGDYDT
jgi:hypothetical protein